MPTRESIAAYLGGGGDMVELVVADPAAGVELSVAVPAGVEWKLRAGTFSLFTDATRATRIVRVSQSLFGGGPVFGGGIPDPGGHSFSRTVEYSVGSLGYTGIGSNRRVMIGTPDVRFRPLDTILATSTIGLQAGDQFLDILLYFEQWQRP